MQQKGSWVSARVRDNEKARQTTAKPNIAPIRAPLGVPHAFFLIVLGVEQIVIFGKKSSQRRKVVFFFFFFFFSFFEIHLPLAVA